MLKHITLILLVIPLLSSAKTITWVTVDFAPYYILNGDNKGLGREQKIIDALQKELPSYDFKYRQMPASRATYEATQLNEAYCIVSLFKTPSRKKYMFFSEQASTIGFAPTVVLHTETLKLLNINPNSPISLDKLINEYKLTLGVAMQRSYGEALDQVITAAPQAQKVIRPGRDSLASLTYMLAKKRVDMIIGYPSEHQYLKTTLKTGADLAQLKLKEVNKFVHGYIGCSKDENSQAFLKDADKALSKLNKQETFYTIMQYWVPEQFKLSLLNYIRSQ